MVRPQSAQSAQSAYPKAPSTPKRTLKEQDQKIDEYIARLCKNEKVSIEELISGSRCKEVSGVRALIAIGSVKRHGVALAEVASG